MAEQIFNLKEPLVVSTEEPAPRVSILKNPSSYMATKWLGTEIGVQLRIALPMICVNLLWFSIQVVSVMFVGHLGELALSSASMANSMATVTGSSLLMGMASGLETLCGQAYGAKQYRMLGVFLQRAILVLCISSIPVAFLWWNLSSVLIALGQSHEISIRAGLYARWLIPNLFAYAFTQPLFKFLQTQSIVLPMALISLITLLLHLPLCWLVIFKLGLGFEGAAIATDISNWLTVLMLVLYVKFSPECIKTWQSFSREAYRDLGSFFKLAIPAAIMICLEVWSFEGLVIVSGLLPEPQLETSTFTICLTNLELMYMVPFGLSAAVSTRVANELGAGCPQPAKSAVKVTVSMAVLEGLGMAILLVSLLRNIDGWAFSNDIRVVNYVAKCMPLLAALVFMDSIQGVLSGVARGCGWQDLGAYTNLVSFYGVALPLSAILAFLFHLNGLGLWIGMIVGMAIKCFILVLITVFTDWDKQALKAMRRVLE